MTVTTVCFPEDDVVFVGEVGRIVGEVRRLVTSMAVDAPIVAAVEALLRESYPLAVVSPRQSMATVDGADVWYVFRDGGVVRTGDST